MSLRGGSVSPAGFLFDHVGTIVVSSSNQNMDDMMELALEAGADDLTLCDEVYEIETQTTALNSVAQALVSRGVELVDVSAICNAP